MRPDLEAASWISTDVADSALGHIERHCEHCHREWVMGQPHCPQCGGHIFVEKIVNPTPVEAVREADSPAGNKWKFWRKPEAPKLAPPDPADLEAVKRLLSALYEVDLALPGGDGALRRLLNAGYVAFGPAQVRVAELAGERQQGDNRISLTAIIEQAITETETKEHVRD